MKKLLLLVTLFAIASPAWAGSCKISEYRLVGVDSTGRSVPVAVEPAVTTQTVTYTTSSESAALNESTRFIRIVCDAKAHFTISAAGTNATANSPYLSADTPEYFGVQAGKDMIVDFYDGTS